MDGILMEIVLKQTLHECKIAMKLFFLVFVFFVLKIFVSVFQFLFFYFFNNQLLKLSEAIL